MRKFLYSRWFFLFLSVVCLVDLVADISEFVWSRTDLNYIAIALDIVAAAMALWIFVDLQRRKPKHGGNPGRR